MRDWTLGDRALRSGWSSCRHSAARSTVTTVPTNAGGVLGANLNRNHGADFIRFLPLDTARDHLTNCLWDLTSHAAGNAIRDRVGFLAWHTVDFASNVLFLHHAAGHDRHASDVLLGDNPASTIGNALRDGFANPTAGSVGDLTLMGLADHSRHLVGNLSHDNFGNTTGDLAGNGLLDDFRNVTCALNFTLNGLRAVNLLTGGETWALNDAGTAAAAGVGVSLWDTLTRMIDLAGLPAGDYFGDATVFHDGTHDGLSAFTSHRLTDGSACRVILNTDMVFPDWTLNRTLNFANVVFPDRLAGRVRNFSFGSFLNLSTYRIRNVTLSAIKYCPVGGDRLIFINRVINRAIDNGFLSFPDRVCDSAIAGLTLHLILRIAARLGAGLLRTVVVTTPSAITSSLSLCGHP